MSWQAPAVERLKKYQLQSFKSLFNQDWSTATAEADFWNALPQA